jgi:uridine kinase
MKIKLVKTVADFEHNLQDFSTKSNILLVTGLSGSGKSYLSKQLAQKHNATIFQPEWLKHTKHITEECRYILDSFFDLHPDIVDLAKNKWNNSKNEDDNELFKKYINLFFEHFLQVRDKDKLYIVEGLQLFTLIDFDHIKNYPIIVKGTSSFNSLKNRYKRDYQKRKNEKFCVKVKFFFRVLKESKLYQFKHRQKLNKFIVKKGTTL